MDVEKAQHWDSRGHFFGEAAEAMRRILVEKARRKNGPNGGGGWRASDPLGAGFMKPVICRTWWNWTKHSIWQKVIGERQNWSSSQFFAGLTRHEAAEAIGVSRSTADEHWAYASAAALELSGECQQRASDDVFRVEVSDSAILACTQLAANRGRPMHAEVP